MKPPSNDPRVERLLEELMSSERSPAEVCHDAPELLDEVAERWRALRAVQAQVSALFPASPGGDGSAVGGDSPSLLPQVPGHAIEGVLGRGGMGIVYRARQLSLNRVVALKVLLVGVHASARELARFRREAEVVGALRHPNIVQVFDTGEAGGWPFFTMEFMEGGSLAERLGAKAHAAGDAATLVATLADAVESAHRCGVIHRDLKPANVLLTVEGTPKISDFGLARRADEVALTQSGARLGTPAYMPPEQALGKLDEIGPATDVYALGVILYELIAGSPPFEAPTPGELQRLVVHEPPAPPSRRNAKVPRDLETICLCCLQKEPARRYPTAAELSADLHRFLRHEPILARPAGRAERAWRWCRRKPALAGLLITGVTLCALAIASLQREMSLATQRRAELAKQALQVDGVVRLAGEGRLAAARAGLEGLSDGGSDELRGRIARAGADLELAEKLERIRLQRAVLDESAFGTNLRKAVADEQYGAAFAPIGSIDDAPANVAVLVAASGVRSSLVGALDDWAMCTEDEQRRSWVLDVAQRADATPTEWLRRLRDASAWRDGDVLDQLARAAPDDQPVTLLVGLGERLRGAHRDETAFLQRVLQRHPGDFWANFGLARAFAGSDAVASTRYYQAAVALRPDVAVPRTNLARSLIFAGRYKEASEELRVAIAIDPTFVMAHVALANFLTSVGQAGDAIAEYETALRLDPRCAEAHSNLGVALFRADRMAEAVDHYDQALRIDPSSGETRANLGNALGALGRIDEAIAQYRRAVELAPESSTVLYGLGRGLSYGGRFEEAIGYLRRAVRADPKNQLAHVELAECLKDRGQIRDAIAIYQHCLELRVDDDRPRVALQRMQLLQEGRGEDACRAWRDWLEKMPPVHCLWEGYAELCAFVGLREDYDRARETLTSFGGDDADPHTLGRVAFACALVAGSEEQMQRATEQIERAVTADTVRCETWERPWFLLAKGLLAYRSGRFDDALALVTGERSKDIGAAPRLVAAMACHRLDRTSEARALFAAAVAGTDWRAARAIHRDTWVEHVLRREAEALLMPDLPALLAGQRAPRDQDERLSLLGVCQFEGRHVMTARLYTDALAADPQLFAGAGNDQCLRATRAAASAGSGRGVDAAGLSAKDMADWRAQARTWLREALARWRGALDRDLAGNREAATRAIGAWPGDPSFASLREPQAGDYGQAERDECRALWSEVQALLDRAAAR